MATVLGSLMRNDIREDSYSQESTSLLLDWLRGFQGGQDGLIKHVFQALLREGGALHVLDCSEFPGQLLCGLDCDGLLLHLGELLNGGCVITQINLCAHQEEGGLGTVVGDFRNPLQGQQKNVNFLEDVSLRGIEFSSDRRASPQSCPLPPVSGFSCPTEPRGHTGTKPPNDTLKTFNLTLGKLTRLASYLLLDILK